MLIELARCTCRECREGDALPERLQGWPGAYQTPMNFSAPKRKRKKAVKHEPIWKSDPRWADERLREACLLRCGEDGDPACFEMSGQGPVEAPYDNAPCDDCLRDCGIEPAEPIDPNAVVAPLL